MATRPKPQAKKRIFAPFWPGRFGLKKRKFVHNKEAIMSVVTTNEVQEVSAVSSGSGVGTILAATVVATLLGALSSAAREVFSRSSRGIGQSPQENGVLAPSEALRVERKILEEKAHRLVGLSRLGPTESLKVQTLLTLTATPYRVNNPATLEQPLRAIRVATTEKAVREARSELLRAVETSQDQIFTAALAEACIRAAKKVGFNASQKMAGPTGATRIVASDPAGRALITEISNSSNGRPVMATEIVGVFDGSCAGIIDAFEKALEADGVRGSTPRRKFTGGVCELAAAREFVRKKVYPVPAVRDAVVEAKETDSATRRRKSMNSPKGQTQRSN